LGKDPSPYPLFPIPDISHPYSPQDYKRKKLLFRLVIKLVANVSIWNYLD
ncbi:775_t:CDS:2, partial [Acaulospora morrowiae]